MILCLAAGGTVYLIPDEEFIAVSTLQLDEKCSAQELLYSLSSVECQDIW